MATKENVVIWGTGQMGASKFLLELLQPFYRVVAYADSNERKWGTLLNGLEVVGKKKVKEYCVQKKISRIIIAVHDKDVAYEIREDISRTIEDIIINWYPEIATKVENRYIYEKKKNLKYENYSVDYTKQAEIWVDNLMSEVHFWADNVARKGTKGYEEYKKRLLNKNFESDLCENIQYVEAYLEKICKPIVYDIGCGLAPRFGTYLPSGKEIIMTGIDPLAYYYNEINKECAPYSYRSIEFGMFEFLSAFKEKQSADVVIINNALDHCIDPYKSILEALRILKVNGLLHLNHARAEGFNGKYEGLHQWNLDYNEKDDFIIWNSDMAINISEKLRNVADIIVTHSDDSEEREQQFICVEIIKRKEIVPVTQDEIVVDLNRIAFVLDKIMNKWASPVNNTEFGSMLRNEEG